MNGQTAPTVAADPLAPAAGAGRQGLGIAAVAFLVGLAGTIVAGGLAYAADPAPAFESTVILRVPARSAGAPAGTIRVQLPAGATGRVDARPTGDGLVTVDATGATWDVARLAKGTTKLHVRFGAAVTTPTPVATVVAGTELTTAVAGVRSSTLPILIALQLGLWLGIAGVPLVASRRLRRGGAGADLGVRARPLLDVPIGLAAGLGSAFAVNIGYSLLLPDRLQVELADPASDVGAVAHGVAARAVLFIFIAVLTPLAEEIFFRGALFGNLRRLLPLWVAAPVAAALFGLAHGELLQLPGLAFFGLVLCLVYQRTRRLGPCIVAHLASTR